MKTNLKGIYKSFDCTACGNEEESQQHVLEFELLRKLNKEIKEKPVYEKTFEGNVSQLIYIEKILKKTCPLRKKV